MVEYIGHINISHVINSDTGGPLKSGYSLLLFSAPAFPLPAK